MTTAGRPRTSSKATIADAAAELFIENSYAGTTIDQITQRAGVSRATFFNYFSAKTDLLWVDVDAAITQLDQECDGDLRASVLAVASGFEGTRVPLALSQSDVMGSSDEILQSGLVRVAALARVFARTASRTDAYVLAGAVSAGWLDWVRAGIGRDPLSDYLEASLARTPA
jgi:AcrR family transcriptional regulator